MTGWIVGVVGVVGWLAGIVLLVRLRDTSAPPPLQLDPDAPPLSRIRVVATRAAGGLAGSIVASLLVIGCGGRLMMRVLAATSPDRVQGAVTDMDAIVGQPTIGGTIFFVVFLGMGMGVIGWVMRTVLRRWLPKRSIVAGLVGAGIGAGVFGNASSLLRPENIDFDLLSPAWLAITLILGMIVTFGMLLAVLSDRWAATWQVPQTPWGHLRLAPLLAVGPLPPLLLAVAATIWIRATVAARRSIPPFADRLGPAVTLAAAAAGTAVSLVSSVKILTG